MKGRSCCSTCLFTGSSIWGRRPLIFKHGGHLSYGGKSGTFADVCADVGDVQIPGCRPFSTFLENVLFGFI